MMENDPKVTPLNKQNLRRKRRSSLWLNKPKRSKKRRNDDGNTLHEASANSSSCTSAATPSENNTELNVSTFAPRKEIKRHRITSRKKLFESSSVEKLTEEIQNIIPSVIHKFKKVNLLFDFHNFLKLLCLNKFPLTNIAFLLFIDVVRWYSLTKTSGMKYNPDSLKFWKVMYRLFHGKVLRFMSGVKSTHLSEGNRTKGGNIDPGTTSINFAVPSQNVIANYCPTESCIPKEVKPGIINDALKRRPTNQCYVLSVDGKKLATGLTSDKGDIDLLGFEEHGETLESAKKRIEKELKQVDHLCDEMWENINDIERQSEIKALVLIVSCRIKDLRIIFLTHTKALKRFEKEAGTDWRNSKYVYAISSVQCHIFQIRSLIKRLLEINDNLLAISASVNKVADMFAETGIVDAFEQANWVSLKETDDLPDLLKGVSEYTKQRSEEWFNLRKKFLLTGSKLYEGIGLETLKSLNKHIENLKNPDKAGHISEAVLARMEHGTKSEINAIATLTGKILPAYFPRLKYIEEGSHLVSSENKIEILVSPDGSIGEIDIHSLNGPIRCLACEFKCPVGNDFCTPVHYEIPLRYVPQILAEMACMNVPVLIYLCWTAESATVFRATYDESLWNMIIDEATKLYGEDLKKQTKLSENSKLIKSKLLDYRMSKVEFLCEVKSLTGSCVNVCQTTDTTPYNFPVYTLREKQNETINVKNVLNSVSAALKEAYELNRKKATEVLVWLLSDTDRKWNAEIPHSVPVAYALKGYSLGTKPMRNIHNYVLQACHDQNLDVICSCFDGQWIRLATRDENDRPLTILQLQRDVEEKAKKISRNAIIKDIVEKQIIKDMEEDIVIERDEQSGAVYVSSSTFKRMILSAQSSVKLKHVPKSVNHNDNISCLPDNALETLSEETVLRNDIAIVNDDCPFQDTSLEIENSDTTEQIPIDSNIVLHRQTQTACNSLSEIGYQNILCKLKSHPKQAIRKSWTGKTADDLKHRIMDISELQKMTHDELNVFIEETKEFQNKCKILVRKSWKLVEKANGVSKLIGSGEQIVKETVVRQVFSLKECAARIIRSNPKTTSKQKLNNVYAAFIFKSEEAEWFKRGMFENYSTYIENVGKTKWFSVPEFSSRRNKFEPKCLDAHHLLVNARAKVCKDGVENIKKEAWHSVAEKEPTIINKALVVDLIDKQNNAYALKVFSVEVEKAMRKLEFPCEADFCNIIRSWYEAEDQPGLSASERVRRRLRMKDYLLTDIDFGVFPAFGLHVKGFSKVWFEGMLQRIDTTIQLYSTVQNGTYNQRAISSLVNETFFGELSDMEPTKLGCPKAVSIPRLMATVSELMHYRCDPSDRVFHMTTTRKSVYQKEPLLPRSPAKEEDESQKMDKEESLCGISKRPIILRDHSFDQKIRQRKQRKSKRSDVSKPQAVSRGCLPIRQHHKCDESKILPTTRLGIDLNESNMN